jgi:hypothetical protein
MATRAALAPWATRIAATFKARTLAARATATGAGGPLTARRLGRTGTAFGRRLGRARIVAATTTGGAYGTLKIASVTTRRRIALTTRPLVTTFTVATRRAAWSLFVLGPRGPETEALKLR